MEDTLQIKLINIRKKIYRWDSQKYVAVFYYEDKNGHYHYIWNEIDDRNNLTDEWLDNVLSLELVSMNNIEWKAVFCELDKDYVRKILTNKVLTTMFQKLLYFKWFIQENSQYLGTTWWIYLKIDWDKEKNAIDLDILLSSCWILDDLEDDNYINILGLTKPDNVEDFDYDEILSKSVDTIVEYLLDKYRQSKICYAVNIYQDWNQKIFEWYLKNKNFVHQDLDNPF